MNIPDILAALVPVVDAFERLGVHYYIGGSVASSAHGIARATLDVDLIADLQPRHIAQLVNLLQETYYIDADMIRDAIRRESSFNLIHLETMLKLDVYALAEREFDQETFVRRRRDTLDETDDAREFYLASAEDVILHKLEWFHLGGGVSERQWGDVIGVLKVQAGTLDFAYLRRWAKQLGLGELLERAVVEAGIEEAHR